MNVRSIHPEPLRHRKQLFVPVSEFQLVSYPLFVRPMRLGRTGNEKYVRVAHFNQKGVRSCQHS